MTPRRAFLKQSAVIATALNPTVISAEQGEVLPIALIGCGALGMVLGSELKKHGIIAIVMGGATQVLFGIKGQRWATHSVISHFWNEAWVWPNVTETPRGASSIEGGCYWGGKN